MKGFKQKQLTLPESSGEAARMWGQKGKVLVAQGMWPSVSGLRQKIKVQNEV